MIITCVTKVHIVCALQGKCVRDFYDVQLKGIWLIAAKHNHILFNARMEEVIGQCTCVFLLTKIANHEKYNTAKTKTI